MTDLIEVLPSKSGKGYFWRKRAGNNEITATSGSEAFESPFDAKAAAQREFGEWLPVRVVYRKDTDGE